MDIRIASVAVEEKVMSKSTDDRKPSESKPKSGNQGKTQDKPAAPAPVYKDPGVEILRNSDPDIRTNKHF